MSAATGAGGRLVPAVSVLMPTFRQAAFIARAIESLRAQTLRDWELLIVDDASPDDTLAALKPYVADPRVRYRRLARNEGLGAALNHGLAVARAPLIAYLPSDDVYYPEHLASLVRCLDGDRQAVLAYAGVRHHYNRSAAGQIDGYPLQLVQVLHRRTPQRWLERRELVTDDLGRMFWDSLRGTGNFVTTNQVTCEWVDHPQQRHKAIREPEGGLNVYRTRYAVREPLNFHSTVGNHLDEVAHYRRFRERPDTPQAANGLRILLVGELAYNPERVLALEERGHKLYGLWMPEPHWFNSVGPQPFGHVEDIPLFGWQEAVQRIKPDVIYALLNWQAVPFAYEVLTNNPGVPFVWHFKEGPFICIEKGTWPQLAALYSRADGRIYSSLEMRDWFAQALPGCDCAPSLVLDGDLPKREWFDGTPSPKLSECDGEIHTVVPGRPIGLHVATVGELADQGIHLHFYGNWLHTLWREWIERAQRVGPRHLHLHGQVDQDGWVKEFSRYDAGWLHCFRSENGGDLRRANWDDLNLPARIPTLLAAGLPLLQRDNSGAIVAPQTLARRLDVGVFFTDVRDLGVQLHDRARLAKLQRHAWAARDQLTFDAHADELIDFFRRVVARSTQPSPRSAMEAAS